MATEQEVAGQYSLFSLQLWAALSQPRQRVIGIAIDATPFPGGQGLETALLSYLVPWREWTHLAKPPSQLAGFLAKSRDIQGVIPDYVGTSMEALLPTGFPRINMLFGSFVSAHAWVKFWEHYHVLDKRTSQTFLGPIETLFGGTQDQSDILIAIALPHALFGEIPLQGHPHFQEPLYPAGCVDIYNKYLLEAYAKYAHKFKHPLLLDLADEVTATPRDLSSVYQQAGEHVHSHVLTEMRDPSKVLRTGIAAIGENIIEPPQT